MAINYKKPINPRDLRNGDWFWVNRQVWQDKELTQSDKVVYGTLAYFSNRSQEAHPSLETLAQFSRISNRQVYRSIKILEELGYLKIERGGGRNNPNIYQLLKVVPGNRNPDNMSGDNENPDKPVLFGKKTLTNNTRNNNKRTIKEREEDKKRKKDKKKPQLLPYRSIKYLLGVSEEDFPSLSVGLVITPDQIRDKAEDLYNYCEAKGKRYKNYKAFLRNALKRDFPRKPEGPVFKIIPS